MKLKLTKRMTAIYEQITDKRIADIGCDHGKISILALTENKVDYVIFSDISAPSVNKVKLLLPQNLSQKCDIRVGDGLQTIKENDGITQAIVSGMGGKECVEILKYAPVLCNSYIFQPQNNEFCLKKFVIENGFSIVYDIIVQDRGKFYNVFKCLKNSLHKFVSRDEDEFFLYFGSDNFDKNSRYASDFKNYLQYLEKKVGKILQHCKNSEKYKKDIEKYEKMCKHIALANKKLGE